MVVFSPLVAAMSPSNDDVITSTYWESEYSIIDSFIDYELPSPDWTFSHGGVGFELITSHSETFVAVAGDKCAILITLNNSSEDQIYCPRTIFSGFYLNSVSISQSEESIILCGHTSNRNYGGLLIIYSINNYSSRDVGLSDVISRKHKCLYSGFSENSNDLFTVWTEYEDSANLGGNESHSVTQYSLSNDTIENRSGTTIVEGIIEPNRNGRRIGNEVHQFNSEQLMIPGLPKDNLMIIELNENNMTYFPLPGFIPNKDTIGIGNFATSADGSWVGYCGYQFEEGLIHFIGIIHIPTNSTYIYSKGGEHRSIKFTEDKAYFIGGDFNRHEEPLTLFLINFTNPSKQIESLSSTGGSGGFDVDAFYLLSNVNRLLLVDDGLHLFKEQNNPIQTISNPLLGSEDDNVSSNISNEFPSERTNSDLSTSQSIFILIFSTFALTLVVSGTINSSLANKVHGLSPKLARTIGGIHFSNWKREITSSSEPATDSEWLTILLGIIGTPIYFLLYAFYYIIMAYLLISAVVLLLLGFAGGFLCLIPFIILGGLFG